jgi:hypothetical protein
MNYRSIMATLATGSMLAGCAAGPATLNTGSTITRMAKTISSGSQAILYVADTGSALEQGAVTIYGAKKGNLKATIADKVNSPRAILLNSSGDLIVANYGGSSVTIYDAKTRRLLQKLKVSKPRALTLDPSGDLYVLNAGSVSAFSPSTSNEYDSKPYRTITSGIKSGEDIAADAKGNVYVTNFALPQKGGNTVTVYEPGSDSPSQTITDGLDRPYSIALDSSQNIYIGNLGSGPSFKSSVTVYQAGTASLTATITNGVANQNELVFDSGNLYVVNDKGDVTEYAPSTFELIRTLVTGDLPVAITFDSRGNAYVANASSKYCDGVCADR